MRQSLWVYPLFGGVGAGFGYWMMGVEERQTRILSERKERLLEKRARKAQRERDANDTETVGILASTS